MKFVKEFLIIILFLCLGSILSSLIDFPIPDTVFGMILLFLALNFKIVKLKDVEDTGNHLIGLISLFLVPSSVSFISIYESISGDLFKIFAIVIISTIITMSVTALTVNALRKRI